MSIHKQVIFATEQQVKNIGFTVYSPISGKITPLINHPQTIFSSGILGCGLAFEVTSHKIVAPFDGIVEQIKLGGSEVYFKAKNGIKLLIALEIDQEYFPLPGLAIKKQEAQQIKAGEPIIHFDLRKIPVPIYGCVTILNHQKLGAIYYSQSNITAGSDVLFKITSKKR
ncbi:PTS glucose transporter subunit IIA [Pseudoalteromonas denitrificans]|jgi:phosphotransferase system IIA component|uniref:PTS system glucose-specific EIIA component n=1 Tax=Pseudoalteromonas denitrificans DSM 6059 TaxID=1123010 RepID=A0A1I1MX33_9GAMM|nr:PTS glucose transporter subunit IIA [Pseudoalteromonas denitrificans]SFC87808.1 PTS system IIA component, Glc family [Pseudoalteromonas denitrificans DSM 6059]